MDFLYRADLRLYKTLTRKSGTEYNNSRTMHAAKRAVRAVLARRRDKRPAVMIMCYSFYGGGAERVACTLASALAADYRVIMLCVDDKKITYPLDPSISLLVLPRFEGDSWMIADHWAELTRWMKTTYRVRASVSFMFSMNRLNVRSRAGERVICSERNNPAKREPQNLEAIAEVYESADLVVFQTERVRALFGETVRAHSAVIANPVAVDERWSCTAHRIVNVGRLTAQKNQTLLLRAFARFHGSHPEYTLSIYGDGPMREELARLADGLGIAGAVSLEGNVPEVHSRISGAEMFVLSSDYEGMSNALLEAMAMGMPCISTACEGSDEIMRSGENGLLTAIGDEAELCAAMCRLADDAALREKLGRAAFETARAFRTERIVEKWKRLIEKDPQV